jgi:uncharacterized protein YqfA (UPF0365 family)
MSLALFANNGNPNVNGNFLLEHWPLLLGGIGLIVGLIFLFIFFSFVRLWIQAFLASARIGLLDMIRMKLLNIDYNMIVRQKIALIQAGVKVSTQEMEAHVRSRGNVQRVVGAVIAAHKAGMDLPSTTPTCWPTPT